jgi:small-conductance mechanosensitive channel
MMRKELPMANAVNSLSDVTAMVTSSKDAVLESFSRAFHEVIQLAPKVLVMAVVLVVGYIAARLVGQAIGKLSEKIGLQTAAERSGLAQSMQHMGIKRGVPAILGTIVFWLLMCVFVMASFNILGLEKLSQAMQSLVDYIPKVLVATVLVVIGLLVASFLRGLIATSADRVGISYASQLASACYYVLAVLTFSAAFNQLGIAFALLDNLIMIAFGGLAVGFGLSFGLGGRDVMAGVLAGYYLRQRLQAGDRVTVGGLEGQVREVGPVATIVETEEDGLLNRHTIPNSKMLNEAVR